MKKLNVAVLGLGEHQLKGIRTLRKSYNIFGFDSNNFAPGKKFVKKFYNIQLSKKKEILEICYKNNIIKSFAFNTEAPLRTVYYINSKIEKKKINFTSIQNKYFLRKKLKKNSLPVPKFFLYKNISQLRKLKYPFVVKPVFGSGSRGVFFSRNYIEFKRLYKKFYNNYKNKKILVEQYIPGVEFAVDGWIDKNCNIRIGAISKKKRSKGPNLFDKSLIINYQNKKIYNKLTNYLEILFKILKIENQIFHIEFKYQKNKIYLIDFSIRGAGYSVYSEILSKILNQNTDQILIDMWFGKLVKIKSPSKELFYLFFFDKSQVRSIKNHKEKIQKLNSFRKIKFYNYFDSNLKVENLRLGHILLSSFEMNFLKRDISLLRKMI